MSIWISWFYVRTHSNSFCLRLFSFFFFFFLVPLSLWVFYFCPVMIFVWPVLKNSVSFHQPLCIPQHIFCLTARATFLKIDLISKHISPLLKNHLWFSVYKMKSKVLRATVKALNLPFRFHFHSLNPSYSLLFTLYYKMYCHFSMTFCSCCFIYL